ncbi:anhydro-N-acetylmuramic acid kinase [Polymorphobacter fuscus]|uniref:Anhydro-N-acetylmuramic acid kinase n=1 Tax=Sandarakinorhabdus fusca TaxID=1439888 RepID=A0A7C9KLL5_9SPHN|nr:anhydro-N-acetylmuramic acid kinase [Polymorphobacter fuscus]KAB7648823.1 anhydro-N-acetylmuramic acid kinase [Polymorphobacter fuscus]MQT16404.1 anhydro-N-acetylmuramic acid kinase [Polymorphobacter fuscus]NJC07307.1 anhydro-N-acetylmuramic acid kinase [Polymorphobacter fuscus]
MTKTTTAIGLMSGTSMDGIDAALIETDGENHVIPRGFLTISYEPDFVARLRDAAAHALECHRPGPDALIDAVAAELTGLHAIAVHRLLAATGTDRADVAIIGFHGHTVAHRPDRGWTWQIGDGALMQTATRIPVAFDFRSADVAAGGQGAPLAPGYHRARSAGVGRPLGVLNLGGVGNLTWFSGDDWGSFDTGPANALIDDWVARHGTARYDKDGAIAAGGTVQESVLTAMLDLPWFDLAPPKSLDRADFTTQAARGLGLADGAATLTAFTAETIRLALGHVPPIGRLLVTGGGRHNPTLMAMIADRTGVPTEAVEAVGWNGDALEAEAFAWLAVRTAAGKPISWPETTGVPAAMTGGRLA